MRSNEFGTAKGWQAAPGAVVPLVVLSTTLAGCSGHGAPSYVLFGAYFPGWMFCAVTGIIGAIAARGIFVALGLDHILPFQLFVCASVGLLVATLTWLLWFGQ